MSLYTSLYEPAANMDAEFYGIPQNTFDSLIMSESSFNPYASNQTAYGIAQFEPSTAQEYGVNTSDPTSSLSGAGQYLSDLYNKLGSWAAALTAYKYGIGGVNPTNEQTTMGEVFQGAQQLSNQDINQFDTALGGPTAAATAMAVGKEGPSAALGNLFQRGGIFIIGGILLVGGLFLLKPKFGIEMANKAGKLTKMAIE